ncbi:MAG: hypothetical protein JWO58_2777 [Chitinophagaceae bacterium]|nr:hypothetical protein [Chitinophagaceae bacterium]
MLRKIVFATLLLSITSLSAFSYSPSPDASDILIIRIFHPLSNGAKGAIKVFKNNETPVQIELPPQTDMDDNNSFKIIREVLNKYTLEGYSIVSSTESTTSVGKVFTTYVLEKK